jgi:diguanylate cyclase (GGDEF)-like protein
MMHNFILLALIVAATITIVGLYIRLWRKLRRRERECEEITRRYEQALTQSTQRAQDIEQLKQGSIADELTGLKSQCFFLEALRTEWKRASRCGQSIAVLMIELDGLERATAVFGQPENQRVLARAARLLQEKSRHSNVVARFGENRFVVLLPEADLESAKISAGRLRIWMENDPVLKEAEITGSFGVAAHPVQATTEEELLRLAEAGIRAAKARGGNCVETGGPAQSS